MYSSIWNALDKYISVDRMREEVEEFFQLSRWSSFDKINALAELIVEKMEAASLDDARLIDFPADGKTAYGGWVLPKAYNVEEARLIETTSGDQADVLADYHQNPTSLMMYSQSTPEQGVTAELVIVDRPEDMTADRVFGRIVLTSGRGIQFSQGAIKAGAHGIVSDFRGMKRFVKDGPYLDKTNEWHNYSIPPWDEPKKGFGFAITPNQGRRLRNKIEAGDRVTVRALVKSRHYDGNLPVVSGLLQGWTAEEIAITGHYDEFGADDNCSQVAVALEAVRAIRSAIEAGDLPPPTRSIRILLPMEVRGFNALIQNDDEIRNLRAGLNIDTVGTDQNLTTTQCTLTENFLALPSFVDDFAAELLGRVQNPLFRWECAQADSIDNIFGEPLVGAPTPSIYHFSGTHHLALDTPDRISDQMLLDMARVTSTYAAFLASAGLDESFWLSELTADCGVRKIWEVASSALQGESSDGLIRSVNALRDRYTQKIKSTSWLVPYSDVFSSRESLEKDDSKLFGEQRLLPHEFHALRLDELHLRIDEAARDAELLSRRRITTYHGALEATPRDEKSRIVPVKAFRGFLSFETFSPQDQDYITEKLNIGIDWGVSMWLNQALMLANGKRTVSDIVATLRSQAGWELDVQHVEKIFKFLKKKKLVRVRNFVESAAVQSALDESGLQEGDVVIGHFSLSQFGYIEGGAENLIDILLDLLGPTGTLMMPTFTFSTVGYLPYDRERSPSRVGAVTDAFWRRPDVIRSAHPTHSFAATGKLANQLLGGHQPTDSPISKDGPIGRLAETGGKVLMFCDVGPNTSMHAGDYWSGIPLAEFICHYIENGERKEVTVPGSPWHAIFDKAYEKLYAEGKVKDVVLGESQIHLMTCQGAINAQAEVATNEPETLICPGCECPYCERLKEYVRGG